MRVERNVLKNPTFAKQKDTRLTTTSKLLSDTSLAFIHLNLDFPHQLQIRVYHYVLILTIVNKKLFVSCHSQHKTSQKLKPFLMP